MKQPVFFVIALLALLSGCACPQPQQVAENRTPYGHPRISSGVLFGLLPPTVQNTVRAETGSAELTNVSRFVRSGRTVYRIDFDTPEFYPPLYVGADGAVLGPNLKPAVGAALDPSGILTGAAIGLKFDELPPDVQYVTEELEPDAEPNTISKETWGNQTIYVLSFKDEDHHPKLYVTADGKVLKGPNR